MSSTLQRDAEAFTQCRKYLDQAKAIQARGSSASQVKRNHSVTTDQWMDDVVICMGHALVRAEAIELAQRIGDIQTLADALADDPWLGLEPESLEEAMAKVDEWTTRKANDNAEPPF